MNNQIQLKIESVYDGQETTVKTYKVVDSIGTIWIQGTKHECENYKNKVTLIKHDTHNEEACVPIQNALYATNAFTTIQCDKIADGILLYLEDAGFDIVKTKEK